MLLKEVPGSPTGACMESSAVPSSTPTTNGKVEQEGNVEREPQMEAGQTANQIRQGEMAICPASICGSHFWVRGSQGAPGLPKKNHTLCKNSA